MKIGLAHSSPEAMRAVERALNKSGMAQTLWMVSEGTRVLSAVRDKAPNLVLLDACIRNPGALDVAKRLAGVCPVLLLDDQSSQSASVVYDCMAAGAVDVALCRVDPQRQSVDERPLVAKLKAVQSILVQARPEAPAKTSPCVVLIGSSTGGPQALQTILSQLPPDLNAAYVVAQHLDVEFSTGLAAWLAGETRLRVRIATQDSTPEARTVLIAGTNDHLVLNARRRLIYTPEPQAAPYRPSADALFSSFASHWNEKGIAVLLTGMGKDGGLGMLALRKAGWHTIAQDAATSVVFGMPKAAIELGAACQTLPLPAIASAIARECLARSRTAAASR